MLAEHPSVTLIRSHSRHLFICAHRSLVAGVYLNRSRYSVPVRQ